MHPNLWPAHALSPRAHALDTQTAALQQALDDAAQDGMLGLRAPKRLGGHGLSSLDHVRVQVEMARASGTFAFLQTQHQAALGFVSRAEGTFPREQCMAQLATGQVRAGIAYGWLRRPGPPLVRVQPEGTGHRLTGKVPWMTGWGFFSHCVVAARQPDGQVLLAWLDLSSDGVEASPPMRLAAFETARTVALVLDTTIQPEQVIQVVPEDWLARRDPSRAAPQAAFVLGLAWAGLDIITALDPMDPALPGLTRQVQRVDEAVFDCIRAETHAAGHAIRAQAIALAGRLSLAAIAASSGRAAQHDHAAQRVHRDLLGFTVLSQTPAVRRATLDALAAATL